jgi:hypothetical protein
VSLRLLYLIFTRVVGWLALLCPLDASKERRTARVAA